MCVCVGLSEVTQQARDNDDGLNAQISSYRGQPENNDVPSGLVSTPNQDTQAAPIEAHC